MVEDALVAKFTAEVEDKLAVVYNGANMLPLQRRVALKQCEAFLVELFVESLAALRLKLAITTGDLTAADIERKNLAADLVLSQAVERSLREYLWLSHGHKGVYGDDGEMQCSECIPLSHLYDYKREPLEKLVEATRLARQTVNRKALAAALEQTQALKCRTT